jgi:DNA mismatch repair protein MLH1
MSTTPQAIRLLYGHSIAKELLHEIVSSGAKPKRNTGKHANADDDDGDEDEEDAESWSAEAYFTNANYQAKKIVFLLFINRA